MAETAPRKFGTLRDWSRIEGSADLPLEGHLRYPACRVLLVCGPCGWARPYDPVRIIDRLRSLRFGGLKTRVGAVARHVGWNCPACGRVQWRALLAYPPGLDSAELKRMTSRLRS